MPDLTLDPTANNSSDEAKKQNVDANAEVSAPVDGHDQSTDAKDPIAGAADAPVADASAQDQATSSSPSTGDASGSEANATDPAALGQAQPFNPPATSEDAASLAEAPKDDENAGAKPVDAVDAAMPPGGDANLPVGSATVAPSDASAQPDPSKPVEPLTNGVQPNQQEVPPAPNAQDEAKTESSSSSSSENNANESDLVANAGGLGTPDGGVPVTNPVDVKPDLADTDATVPVDGATASGDKAPLGYPVANENPPVHPATFEPLADDVVSASSSSKGSEGSSGAGKGAADKGLDPATLSSPTATTLPDVYTKLTQDGAKLAADLDELADDAGKVLALDLAAAGNLAARINGTLDMLLAHGGKAARKSDAIRDLKSAFDLVQDTISPLVEKAGDENAAAGGESLADKAKSAMSGIEKVIHGVFAKLKG